MNVLIFGRPANPSVFDPARWVPGCPPIKRLLGTSPAPNPHPPPQSGNTLSRILQQLRTGISTDPTATITDVEADLNDLATGLGSLAEAVEQHSTWSRLLTHPSTTGLVASLEVQLSTAQAVLGARRELWEVVSGWRSFLDELYGAPCISNERPKLTEQLEEHVGRLRAHASKITVRLACINASFDVPQQQERLYAGVPRVLLACSNGSVY